MHFPLLKTSGGRLMCAFLLVCALASCVGVDPAWRQNYQAIQDVDYPASQIEGSWMQIGGHKEMVGGSIMMNEERVYLNFLPGGTGLQRKSGTHGGSDIPTVTEVEFDWSYLGKNRWKVLNRASSLKIISETPGWKLNIGNYSPKPYEFRYHDGRLYSNDAPNSFVRMTDEAVSAQLSALRSLMR